MTSIRKYFAIWGTLLALAAFLLNSSASVAMAKPGDTAYQQQRSYLDGYPNPSLRPICLQKNIYLAAGTYDWTVFTYNDDSTIYDQTHYGKIYLGADTYRWRTCIYPQNGHYDVDTYLKAVNHDWRALSWGVHTYLDPLFFDYYTWGSSLRPLSFS